MKYFIVNSERSGTEYYEFCKGSWDGETFWKDDSIYLHDDVLYENQNFLSALVRVKPDFSSFGVTEISREDWERLQSEAQGYPDGCREIFSELDAWVMDTFSAYDCFTVLGI